MNNMADCSELSLITITGLAKIFESFKATWIELDCIKLHSIEFVIGELQTAEIFSITEH